VVQTSESKMEVERESDERWIWKVSKRVSSADDRMDNSLGLDIARLLVVITSRVVDALRVSLRCLCA
jgi:hypothetical protein